MFWKRLSPTFPPSSNGGRRPSTRLGVVTVGAIGLLMLSLTVAYVLVPPAPGGGAYDAIAANAGHGNGNNGNGPKNGHRSPSPAAATAASSAASTPGQTAGPTSAAMPSLTTAPTALPQPTMRPTAAPTDSPWVTPTPWPTAFPTVTPQATLAPTPVPTPVPTATRTPTPTATPAPTRPVYTVPATIDGTGSSDVYAALQSWLNSVPSGATAVFPAGKTYRISGWLALRGKTNFILEGNGATLRSSCTDGTTEQCSLFEVNGGSNVKVRYLNVVGTSTQPGIFDVAREFQSGFYVMSASNVELDHVSASNTWGDGVTVEGWANGVWVHDSTFTKWGRHGFVNLAGKNLLVERNTYVGISNSVGIFDLEPYQASGGTIGFTFRNNTIRGLDFYFAANGGSVEQNLTVSGNTTTGTIRAIIRLSSPRPQQVTITNNVSSGAARPWNPDIIGDAGMALSHIDGLTVSGNVAAVSPARALASISDCTGVSYDGK